MRVKVFRADVHLCTIAQLSGGCVAWISCGKGFIEADVIRWREQIWKPQARTSKKPPTMLGFRTVTGQVLKFDRYGWVHVQVAACSVEPLPRCTKQLYPLEIGKPVRRKRDKIGQGKIERLLWSDESARDAILASKPPRSAT